MRFKFSTSDDVFDKNDGDYAKLTFFQTCGNAQDICILVDKGYAICHCFRHSGELFSMRAKTKSNFLEANMVLLDYDGVRLSFDDIIDRLCEHEWCPSAIYTTANDGIPKKGCDYVNRFRLIYVLDEPVTSVHDYERVYDYINSSLYSLLSIESDLSCRTPDHFFAGCVNGCRYAYDNDKVLSTKELLSKVSPKTIKLRDSNMVLDDTFMSDYYNMSMRDFLDRYEAEYDNLEYTPLAIDEDTPVIQYPENYHEIRRPWKRIDGTTVRLRDGEHRRRKLFLNGIIRRLIKPDITFENMLVNLVWEFEHYYVNDGNTITKKMLYGIAKDVMRADMSEYENYGKPRNKSFANPLYCAKNNLTKRQAINKSRAIPDETIGELYDPSLTDKENIHVMSDYGIDISLITLKRWRKNKGITKYHPKP